MTFTLDHYEFEIRSRCASNPVKGALMKSSFIFKSIHPAFMYYTNMLIWPNGKPCNLILRLYGRNKKVFLLKELVAT